MIRLILIIFGLMAVSEVKASLVEAELNSEELQEKINSYIEERVDGEDLSEAKLRPVLDGLWESSQAAQFTESLATDFESVLRDLEAESVASEINGFILRPLYTEAHARAEQVRINAFFMASQFGTDGQSVRRFFSGRLGESKVTHDDLINAYALLSVSGTGRPQSDPRHSYWVDLYRDSNNPIYRVIALKSVLKSWPDTQVEGETPKGTLKMLVSRSQIMALISEDTNPHIRNLATEKQMMLNELISQIESESGLDGSNLLGEAMVELPDAGENTNDPPQEDLDYSRSQGSVESSADHTKPAASEEAKAPLSTFGIVVGAIAILGILFVLIRAFMRSRAS